MRMIRAAWSLLALAVGGFAMTATYLASWPQSEFTSCEIDPAYDPVACSESLIDRGGARYVEALLVPSALCVVPVVVPRRSVAWATAGTLVVAAIVAFGRVGGGAMMLVPTAVPATVLAGFHRHLAERGATTSVSAQSFLERVHHQQRGE
ncbi:membrane protein (plasmid) [Rhodococcus pyridinivorans SB3094]|uniref:Membrane protein n=1 Tax=Rhodococcus pyridinivorans SB3094 TaxID=1435356 RepID=V9XP34_9NOCA|nr:MULTISPECIES: hypothetical protein [Rhodococcus]AHD24163.1 membrane protein [Rhodococcus pyridinivorans SB3094]AYA23298.1 hypothetical protein C6369_001080 [Rhodococcus rhodochrous]